MRAPPSPHRKRPGPRGFTTIELMAVTAIVSVLAVVALPGFGALLERHRVRKAGEELSASLYLARSEAIRRGGQLAVRKTTSSHCTTSTADDWSCGWVVFADADADGTLDDGDVALQVIPPTRGVTVELNGGSRTHLRLDRWGHVRGLGALSFCLRPANNPAVSANLRLMVASGGRIKTAAADEACELKT